MPEQIHQNHPPCAVCSTPKQANDVVRVIMDFQPDAGVRIASNGLHQWAEDGQHNPARGKLIMLIRKNEPGQSTLEPSRLILP